MQHDPKIIDDTVSSLPSCYNALKNHLRDTFLANTDFEFFRLLCENVLPVLLSIPLLEALRNEWGKKWREHVKKEKKVEKAAIRQIGAAFAKLSKSIKDKDDILTEEERESFTSISDLLSGKTPCGTPPSYQAAHDQLYHLCASMIGRGEEDMVQEICSKKSHVSIDHTDQGAFKLEKIEFTFSFSDKLQELKNLQLLLLPHESEPDWLAWNHLKTAKWAWEERGHSGKKGLEFNTSLKSRRSMATLLYNGLISEMETFELQFSSSRYHTKMASLQSDLAATNPFIHKSTFRNYGFFFNRHIFQALLVNIVRAVATSLTLEIPGIYAKNDAVDDPVNNIEITSIELKVDGEELWIGINWNCHKEESFCLKKFRSEGSQTLEFFIIALESATGTTIQADDHSIAFHCNRANLNPFLKSLFFSNCRQQTATFEGKKHPKVKILQSTLEELVNHLQVCHKRARNPKLF